MIFFQEISTFDVFLSYCWSNSESALKAGHTRAKAGAIGAGDPRVIQQFFVDNGLTCWMDIQQTGKVRSIYKLNVST